MTIDPARYSEIEILRDGSSMRIRALRPDDKGRLLRHFESLSQRSIYQRFFGFKRGLTPADLVRFVDIDFVQHVALVAALGEGEEERFIGVGRYVRIPGRAQAEVAFAVLDEYQGRGIGTLLLEHLGRIARAAGVLEFSADVLGDNQQMLEMFARSGFRVTRSAEPGTVHLSFPTEETLEHLEVSQTRERIAAARSIERLLTPRSVAVIGASRDPEKIGAVIVRNLMRGGFTGVVYPINPAAVEIQGLKSWPSVDRVGMPIDLAVIAVPASMVEGEIVKCARAGVFGVVVITAGFASMPNVGAVGERRLFELVRGLGMRMVGPNCMGLLNSDPVLSLNATLAPVAPQPGGIGFFSQSGALGLAVLDYASGRGLGLSSFVSVGQRADVSNNDLLAYWSEDPRTTVVALYLESVGNPRKFAWLAPQLAQRKPIVAVKSGRSASATRAAAGHSTAFASLDVAVEALFEQAGVIRTNTLEELFDVVAMLATQPVPAGPRVGVVTNANGPGILFADACEASGLTLPVLAPGTLEELRASLPERAELSNPIDMTDTAAAVDYERALAAVGRDASVDSIVAIYAPPMVTRPEEIAAGIARGAGAVPAHKPVLTVFLSQTRPPTELGTGARGYLPYYHFPENAALALAAASRYRRWRDRARGKPLIFDRLIRTRMRAIIDDVLARCGGAPAWLEAEELRALLRCAGIQVAACARTTVDEAPAIAETLGYPLVAKVISPDVAHRSEVGGVIMRLKSAGEVAIAVQRLERRMTELGKPLEAILLQHEVQGGVEALVGVTSDPTFGPLLVCGVGGMMVELNRDVAFRLHPVTDVDAAQMLASLPTAPLLDGYRGSPAADRAALIDLILRVSALVENVPEMNELDLSPVKILAPGAGAVVVDGRMRIAPVESTAQPEDAPPPSR
jgi:acetate---CoA ligase (ADP-forming)